MEKKNYKAVVFDFDGTLTSKENNIWKTIWKMLGYDVSKDSYFAELFNMFKEKNITHQQWCDRTCEKFRELGFSKKKLNIIADRISLLSGVDETFNSLKQNDIQIFIVSGNIRQVILKILKNNNLLSFFNSTESLKMRKINANNFSFDSNNIIKHIKGTNYDFEGKKYFIEQLKKNLGCSSKDILYVCDDDCNDKWVNLSCCDTLYINSGDQENLDKSKGPILLPNVSDLTQILPYILPNRDCELVNQNEQ